ncbi:UV damage endonuclease UvsE [Pseudomonas cremoricolorata]|uniref:UV damage endonuclease UvsE n=1 Tax=Pseudomonas cremoricolorata TaxID=157783 RepID=UPI000429C158|nr:UV damage endonuclease UvsE [Pseudomonas cremoricolorata]
MPRLGFACMYRHPHRDHSAKELEVIERAYNPRTTTLRWVSSASVEAAQEKLLSLVQHNLDAQLQLLDYVASLPAALHMLRLSSDLLPLYSHPQGAPFYQHGEMRQLLERGFAAIGQRAREADIRLSFHPGQFCVLGSDRPEVVEASLAEFEYHADMIRLMGYGQRFQDFKCNVHIAGRLGAAGVRAVWPRLSQVARNVITFENDEKTYGLDDCLAIADLAPVVLDIHHIWIHENHHIARHDPRVQNVIDSWRGVRPVLHYSQPPESLQALGFDAEHKLEIERLLEVLNKRDLYGHSQTMWNDWTNRYALQFFDAFDVMFEAKHKNLATLDFYQRYLREPVS